MEKVFIQRISETKGSELVSFDTDGKMVSDLNPENLTPLNKTDAQQIVDLLRLKKEDGIKYRIKAIGQSIRDYQYYVLTEKVPQMECLGAEIVASIKLDVIKAEAKPEAEPEAEAAPEPEPEPEAEPEAEAEAEPAEVDEEIDAILEAALKQE